MPKPIHILIFSQEYPPYNWGGVAPFTVNLTNGLQALGIQMTLVTIGKVESIETQPNGVRILRVTSSGLYKDEFFEESQGLKRHLTFLKKVKNLYRDIEKPDAVILADGLCYPEAKSSAKFYDVPLITMVNQLFEDVSVLWGGKLDSMVNLEKKYFERSDHLVVGSEYMKRRLNQIGYGDKTSHIYYGWGYNSWVRDAAADFPSHFKPSDFLFIGRMVPEKGLIKLLEAFKMVNQKNKSLTLNIVGDGEEKEEAQNFTLRENLSEYVSFYSAISWPNVQLAFKQSRITIVPSYNEPFGYVGLESMMYGSCPLVSHPTGLSEIVASIPYDCTIPTIENSPNIQIVHVESLAERMLELASLSENEMKKKLSIGRIEASKKFNYITIASRWLDLIESLVVAKESLVSYDNS